MVSVRDLARIEVGSVLTLSAPVSAPGWLKLEGRAFYEAVPVGQGTNKAMQLLKPKHVSATELMGNEDDNDGNA
jgi:flagellar motor switch protein FliM